ncbi:hypothetical protein MNV49_007305 [Pseudohyphozyma bogoriensis]|nr:hypothetical protein MNV49_007305 [Pseudohyphozyma bogoriensis]
MIDTFTTGDEYHITWPIHQFLAGSIYANLIGDTSYVTPTYLPSDTVNNAGSTFPLSATSHRYGHALSPKRNVDDDQVGR